MQVLALQSAEVSVQVLALQSAEVSVQGLALQSAEVSVQGLVLESAEAVSYTHLRLIARTHYDLSTDCTELAQNSACSKEIFTEYGIECVSMDDSMIPFLEEERINERRQIS